MTTVYNVGNYLVDRLQELGVDHMFSIAGDYTAEFVTNYVEPSAIEIIEEVNEVNAGYAADAYARMKGISAACFTYSAGTLCAVNAIAGAYVEKVPIVLINGAPSIQRRLTFQQTPYSSHHLIKGETDLRIFEHITVAAVKIDTPALAPNMIDYALTRCISAKRPIYIELLEDMVTQPCEKPVGKLKPTRSISDPTLLAQSVQMIAEKLRTAKNPLIWIGAEIDRFNLQDQAEKLIKKLNIPYATELLSKAVLSENDAQFVGVFDGQSSAVETQKLFASSDFVLALGIWLSDINSLGDGIDFYQSMCLVATDTIQYAAEFVPQVSVGDIIGQLLTADIPARTAPIPTLPAVPPCPAPGENISYQGFYDYIRNQAYVNEKWILGSDASLNYFGNIALKVGAPKSYIVQPSYSAIGYIGPAATGMSLAKRDDQRVMVFSGDGGFQMSAQCLSTQTRFKLNPIIFVLDNGIYGVEQWLYDASVFTSDKKFLDACVLHRWQYSKLAEVFGCKGWVANTYAELTTAIQGAIENSDSPSIIQVVIPEKSIPTNALWKKN